MSATTQTTRTLTVSPDIIMSLIEAQAGTLAKGYLECVMNSSDAGATKVEITMDATTCSVVDDGKGFRSREEILACFEVFGFKHQEIDEKFARFGLGRAQLWSFMSTVWRTNAFEMDVNIKVRGLDYVLKENVTPPREGLRIDGAFYEVQKTADILATRRQLTELVLFMHIPVYFNGERINQDSTSMKWTHETDDAWILLNENMKDLVVYNLGARVCEFSASTTGVGGVVVTKPGVRLKLNMARNDILVSQCAVWRRIRPYLQAKSDETMARTKRPTEAQLENIAERILAGDLKGEEIDRYKLVTDLVGGRHTLSEFLLRAYKTLSRDVTYIAKRNASPLAEKSHAEKHCFVLDALTLRRFGVRNTAELLTRLKGIQRNFSTSVEILIAALKPVENWRDACKRLSSENIEVPRKEWTPREAAAMAALKYSDRFPGILGAAGVTNGNLTCREFRLGQSETAMAWTDGARCIWINRSLLAEMDAGLSGVIKVLNVMVHEYLHDVDSSGSHVHDETFYERFHRVMVYSPSKESWGMTIGEHASFILKGYVMQLERRKLRVKVKFLQATSSEENFVIIDMPGVNDSDSVEAAA